MTSIPETYPIYLPSGKRSHNYGKSQCLMGKSTINVNCLIAGTLPIFTSLPEGIFHKIPLNHHLTSIFPSYKSTWLSLISENSNEIPNLSWFKKTPTSASAFGACCKQRCPTEPRKSENHTGGFHVRWDELRAVSWQIIFKIS